MPALLPYIASIGRFCLSILSQGTKVLRWEPLRKALTWLGISGVSIITIPELLSRMAADKNVRTVMGSIVVITICLTLLFVRRK